MRTCNDQKLHIRTNLLFTIAVHSSNAILLLLVVQEKYVYQPQDLRTAENKGKDELTAMIFSRPLTTPKTTYCMGYLSALY